MLRAARSFCQGFINLTNSCSCSYFTCCEKKAQKKTPQTNIERYLPSIDIGENHHSSFSIEPLPKTAHEKVSDQMSKKILPSKTQGGLPYSSSQTDIAVEIPAPLPDTPVSQSNRSIARREEDIKARDQEAQTDLIFPLEVEIDGRTYLQSPLRRKEKVKKEKQEIEKEKSKVETCKTEKQDQRSPCPPSRNPSPKQSDESNGFVQLSHPEILVLEKEPSIIIIDPS